MKQQISNISRKPKRVCIYTVNVGGYDAPHPALHMMRNVDYFLLTDDPACKLPGYKQLLVEGGVKSQRKYKAYPYDILPGYDIYVYHDASYSIRRDLSGIINSFTGGFGVKRHPNRDCIYKEGERIVELLKADAEEVANQLYYAKEAQGIPEGFGLQETGILIRDAADSTKELCYYWRDVINAYTHRDQLALPMAIKCSGVEPNYINSSIINTCFKQHPHAVAKPKHTKLPIFYIQPFDRDVNIGKAINDHVACLPDDCWVVLNDHDTMYLHPKTKQQIEDVLNGSGREYDLLSCMTNRIGSPHQCHEGKRSDNYDALHHRQIAFDLHEKNYGEVKQINQGVAGFMMAFRKSVWKQHPFKEKSIYFDTVFSQAVMRRRGKIGLMTGVYIFHCYRPGEADPQSYKEHLKAVV